MNKRQIIKRLAEILGNVKIHPEAAEEIFELIIGGGHEADFIKLLAQRIRQIQELGYEVIKLKCFEKLSDAEGLYSMKFKTNYFNLRIIYSYRINGEILLNCFYERSGKKVSSYKAYIPIAEKRRKEMGAENHD